MATNSIRGELPGTKTEMVHIDEDGCLFIDDPELARKIHDIYRKSPTAWSDKAPKRKGIRVRWQAPDSTNQMLSMSITSQAVTAAHDNSEYTTTTTSKPPVVNSLCNC